jgi:hypothetical protein
MPSPIALSVFLSLAKDKTQFDKVTIRRVNNNFVVDYRDADSKDNYVLTLTNTSLGEYVKTLCQLFLADNDPFADIQFNFLGFPTFMAKRHTFQQNSRLIKTLVTAANIVSESVFADYPEGVYCEDEDEDDEMPGLVSLNEGYQPVGRAPAYEPEWERHY